MSSHGCIIQDDQTTCHESCKTCSNSSFCGNPNACTSCFPDQYKISQFFDDAIFQCLKTCEHFSYQLNDYWFCDRILENNFVPEIFKIKEENAITEYSENFGCYIIVAGICIGGAFVVAAVFVIFKKRSKKYNTVHSLISVEYGFHRPLKIQPLREKKENILEIISNANSFKIGKYLGGGSYSKVHKGILQNQAVAIKVSVRKGRKSIYKELQIYDKVSHPNILPAFGFHFGVDNMLFLALRKFNLKKYFQQNSKKLGFPQLKQYCIQIADGMKYLHGKNILHCDLKIDNILIKDEKGEQVEISDFGCAVDLEHDYELKFNGTITHMAYELLKKSINPNYAAIPSKASDVWSFAVTVWQIFQKSDKFPIDFLTPKDIIANHENGKKLPTPSIPASEILWRYTIIRCFDLDPNVRPSMEELYKALNNYQNAFTVSSI